MFLFSYREREGSVAHLELRETEYVCCFVALLFGSGHYFIDAVKEICQNSHPFLSK